MTRLSVKTCEALQTWDQASSEHSLVPVWDIVTQTTDGRQWVFPSAYQDKKAADYFAECVEDHGSINPEKWTECK